MLPVLLVALALPQSAPAFLGDSVVTTITAEVSGAAARRNLEAIARQHRMRASRGFRAAADFIATELRRHGLEEVTIHEIPADGRAFYGTQKARPAWDVEFAELWEMSGDRVTTRIASFEEMPVSLAQDSDSGNVTAELIDVGAGTSERDYAGKDVRGRLVLISAQPEAAAPLAVDRFGAAGMVSYAPNQQTAWWREDENLVRWGHLDAFSPRRTFAFMVSLKQARAWQERMARNQSIRLRAIVHAARHAGSYSVVTAAITGADPALRNQEIVLSCHLDHQRPGANDNASGCATILEVARTLSTLVRDGRLARPARTLRFVWPPEIEGTMALFHFRPEMRQRFRAVIHMDMVGGGPATKAVFHVTRGPLSLPSFVYDVGQSLGAFVNEQSDAFAAAEGGRWPLVSPEGGKEPLQADLAPFSMGSDHQVYMEGSFRIPAIYLNDWPDRYIHTNFDVPGNIDATKLERAAFIGTAAAYALATLHGASVPGLWSEMQPLVLRRWSDLLARARTLDPPERASMLAVYLTAERAAFAAIQAFAPVPAGVQRDAETFFQRLGTLAQVSAPAAPAAPAGGDGALIFERVASITGPMSVFGYDFFADHHRGPGPRLLSFQGARGSGGAYTYEVLNLVDGRRTAREIRDVVAAEYGPVPVELVVEYLRALESIGVVRSRGP